MRYLIVVNPTAGKGAGERLIPQVRTLLEAAGLDHDLVRTERPWHAADLAYEAAQDGYDVVVAVGGDGTANEVLNGLMRSPKEERTCALGVLCVGRGNDFAFGAGIPADLPEGVRVLADNHRQTIDVGHVVGGDYPGGRLGTMGNYNTMVHGQRVGGADGSHADTQDQQGPHSHLRRRAHN